MSISLFTDFTIFFESSGDYILRMVWHGENSHFFLYLFSVLKYKLPCFPEFFISEQAMKCKVLWWTWRKCSREMIPDVGFSSGSVRSVGVWWYLPVSSRLRVSSSLSAKLVLSISAYIRSPSINYDGGGGGRGGDGDDKTSFCPRVEQ